MMQQQPHHPMQMFMGGAFPPIASVTTEIVQKYLDENKQLILAILDNQNLGKLNECATFQAKLQANLMYLAAVADSQPQPPVHTQVQPTSVLQQQGSQYMTHPHVQQQMAQQSLMVGRNSLQYTPQQVSALHQAQQHLQQQQQAIHQHGINAGAGTSLQMNPAESGMALNNSIASRGFPDSLRGGMTESMQVNRGLGGEMQLGGRLDMVAVSDVGGHSAAGNGNGGSGIGQVGDEPGQSYLKATDDERN